MFFNNWKNELLGFVNIGTQEEKVVKLRSMGDSPEAAPLLTKIDVIV